MASILLGKFVICAAAAAVTPWVVGNRANRRIAELSPKAFQRFSTTLWFVTRVGAFVVLYVLLHQEVRSDATVYFRGVLDVRAGAIPYRDTSTIYGPLFLYIAALPVFLWKSAKAIVAFTMLVELAAIFVWRKLFERHMEPATAREAVLLYLLNPLPFIVALEGQNHLWIAALLGAAFWMLYRGRELASGVFYGFSIVAVKLLPLIYLPAFLFSSRRVRSWTLGALLVLGAGYIPFYAMGIDPFNYVGYLRESTSSGNLPFFTRLSEAGPPRANVLYVGSAAVAVMALAWLRRRRPFSFLEAIQVLCGLHLLMALFGWKTHANYFAIVFLPMCALPVFRPISRWRMACWLLFSTLLTLEPSLWYRWMYQSPMGEINESGLHWNVFFAAEVLLIAFCALYLKDIIAELRRSDGVH